MVNGEKELAIMVPLDPASETTTEGQTLIAETIFKQVMGERVMRSLDSLTFEGTTLKAHYTWGINEADMGHVYDMVADLSSQKATVDHCR